MDFGRFVEDHRGSWRQLEVLLDAIDSRGIRRLGAEQVRDLARLYRKASADLLLARDTGTRADVVDYLESVTGRAYTAIYAARRVRWSRGIRWFVRDWPLAVRRERPYVLLAGGVFGIGLLAAFVLTLADPEAFDHLVDPHYAAFYSQEPGDLRSERFGEMSDSDAIEFSSQMMVNNTRVAVRAFALGLTLGIGTLATLFANGVLLGAIAANFASWDRSYEFWSLILPHGVAEFFAICISGAGGLILADAILRPGRRRRQEALRERGADALALAAMAAPILVFAGLVEGYVTPLSILPDWGKLAFAALTAVGLATWLHAPWLPREERPAGPLALWVEALARRAARARRR